MGKPLAIMHSAYFFDPDVFHTDLRKRTSTEERLDLGLLNEFAREISNDPHGVTKDALVKMRFHQDWFDDSIENVWLGDEWYLMALANHLSLAPSLSNRIQMSYYVMLKVLPKMHWKEELAKKLVYGNSLRLLVFESKWESLINTLGPVEQFGGWLSVGEAEGLLHELETTREDFYSPKIDIVNFTMALLNQGSSESRNILINTYDDAQDMLFASKASGKALYLIVD